MPNLKDLLEKSASLHSHLCPRQVLGVRMGLYAGELLGMDLPQTDKRLYTIAETDGCAVDGISVATNCWVGRRTLRIEDYGKVAATFVDSLIGRAVRIVPAKNTRKASAAYAPEIRSRWEGQLIGYQHMPPEELFSIQWVRLIHSIEEIISQPGMKAICEMCGEEIMNSREIEVGGMVFCKACAGQAYYLPEGVELSNGIPVILSNAERIDFRAIGKVA
jgi:formylmethanofuran dehydrogenase subunit E